MTVSVNCGGINQNVAFKGSHKRTDEGNPYYHTTVGTTAGAVLAVPAFAMNFSSGKLLPKFVEFIKKHAPEDAATKDMKNLEQLANVNKKYGIIMAVVAAGLTLGCGMLVDHIRNNRAKETADLAAKVGVKNALRMGEGVSLSRNGKAYYDSNVGSTYGALLGAGCGVVSEGIAFMQKNEMSKKVNTAVPKSIMATIVNIATFALGGWIMGKIADHNTNKAAERKA